MTKEEIFNNEKHGLDSDQLCGVHESMDEWAKIKATEFFVWHMNKYQEFNTIMANNQPDGIPLWKEMQAFEKATIQERYELFLKSKQ